MNPLEQHIFLSLTFINQIFSLTHHTLASGKLLKLAAFVQLFGWWLQVHPGHFIAEGGVLRVDNSGLG